MTGRMVSGLLASATVLAIVAAGCAWSGASEEVVDAGEETVAAGEMQRIEYGDHPDAFGELWPPTSETPSAGAPVVVLVHGGFWRDGFFLDLMNPLIASLSERGFAVWNIEYRRVGAGGGYPATFQDVADAVDHVGELRGATTVPLDLTRVAIVGHSAGGHLATWAAGRSALPAGAVGAEPSVSPDVAISQAGVLDLVGCARQSVGGSACVDLVGEAPVDGSQRYADTSPTEMVPFDAVVVAVHGELDRIVPSSQSSVFVERAEESGMNATYVAVPGADHFSNLDPGHPAWIAVLDALDRLL